EIGDVRQITNSGNSVNQEAATNLKIGGNLKIGNVKQQG
ncbi:MAG: Fis family transcriptional regulator, partial [Calothrix sp. SM1_7_51]|nr:Fis family transcriptional regulator [Calothrix sp. SM1_7_51]